MVHFLHRLYGVDAPDFQTVKAQSVNRDDRAWLRAVVVHYR